MSGFGDCFPRSSADGPSSDCPGIDGLEADHCQSPVEHVQSTPTRRCNCGNLHVHVYTVKPITMCGGSRLTTEFDFERNKLFGSIFPLKYAEIDNIALFERLRPCMSPCIVVMILQIAASSYRHCPCFVLQQ